MSTNRVYFQNLDAIRFIAAMMVFLHHGIESTFYHFAHNESVLYKFLTVFTNGRNGVSVFFVLSGFLITYLIITEHNRTGKLHIKNFYIRRILRIWPLYFAVVFFSFLLYPGVKSLMGLYNPLASNYVYHLFFLSNFDQLNIAINSFQNEAMIQNITWSVSIEEQFYAFWPLIFLLPKRFWSIAILAILSFSVWFRFANYNSPPVLYFHTFSVLMDLAIGGLFALAITSFKRVRSFFENTNTYFHFFLLVITFSVLYFKTEFLFGNYTPAFGRIINSLLFALIITSQALTVKKSALNFSNFKFATKWGAVTYGIYLLHPIAILILDVSCRTLNINYTANFYSHFGVGVLSFILTLIISRMSYDYYELPFLKLKKKFQFIENIRAAKI